MPSSRNDNHASASGVVLWRHVRREGWIVDTRDNVFTSRRYPHGFRGGLAFRTGRAIRPERNLFWRVGCKGHCREQQKKPIVEHGNGGHSVMGFRVFDLMEYVTQPTNAKFRIANVAEKQSQERPNSRLSDLIQRRQRWTLGLGEHLNSS